MKVSASIIALAVMAFGTAKANVQCETSGASPLKHHVDQVIANARASSDYVCRDSPNQGCGVTHTKWSGGGGAAFQICNKHDQVGDLLCTDDICDDGKKCSGLSGPDTAAIVEQILNECQAEAGGVRAGGIYHAEDWELKLFTRG